MKILTDEVLSRHLTAINIGHARPWRAYQALRFWFVLADAPPGCSNPVIADSIALGGQARAFADLPDILEELQQLRTVARRAIACLNRPQAHSLADLADIIAAAGKIGLK